MDRGKAWWCFWFCFSEALKVIISCCWVPVAGVLSALFLVCNPAVREQVRTRQGLRVYLESSWKQLGFWLEDHLSAPGPCKQRAVPARLTWASLGQEHRTLCNIKGASPPFPVTSGQWAGRTHHAAVDCLLSPSQEENGSIMDPRNSEHRKCVGRWYTFKFVSFRWRNSSLCP